MPRFTCSIFTVAALAVSTAAASAQIYPLTNGPNGTGPNTLDSARGFDGINAVAPERELLYHPERAGYVPPGSAVAMDSVTAEGVAPVRRHVRHRRRHEALR